MKVTSTAATVILAISFSLAHAHDEHVYPALGKVHFTTSCSPRAQELFDRAMLFQHSFWYSAARQGFQQTLDVDPTCAIAYWGLAQSLLANPFNPTPARNLLEGRAAIDKAQALGTGTPREKDFIAAIGAYYAGDEKVTQRARLEAYVAAARQVAARYPQDDEAQIYYALALDTAALPTDKTYARQLEAAAILEPIFARNPEHPGVAHYLVHTYDYPPIARKGLEAAKRFATIAAAAPHAQHMPSHIFTRVGYWKDSIASNAVAARIARENKEADDQLHACDYMVYAFLQVGEDAKARAIIEEMRTVSGFNADRNTAPFALAASPARYFIERGDWTAASQLVLKPSKFAYVDAITHFARAVGAARSGSPDAARDDIAALTTLRDKLRDAKDAYWADQVDIQLQTATAWVLEAQGKHADALRTMTAAAAAEDRTEKGAVTPGPLAPARELLGYMLLGQGMPAEALGAFEDTIRKEPNRLNATYGAAKAAEKAGNSAKAREYYRNVVELTRDSGSQRAEVRDALTLTSR